MPVIDPETCIEFKTRKCKKTCVEACGDRRAIDFRQEEKVEQFHVGTIILSTGFQIFDARRLPYYGYGVYPNVYNALEVERLINASGPTGGELVMRNGKTPASVGIIHCVGSRDVNTNVYCSRVCCLYSLKLAHLIKEHTDAQVYNFYIDLRTPGKGMENFYHRVAEEGTVLVRGRVADVYPDPSDGAGGPADLPGRRHPRRPDPQGAGGHGGAFGRTGSRVPTRPRCGACSTCAAARRAFSWSATPSWRR